MSEERSADGRVRRRPSVAFIVAMALGIMLLAGLVIAIFLPIALVIVAIAAVGALGAAAWSSIRRRLSGSEGRRNVKVIVRDPER